MRIVAQVYTLAVYSGEMIRSVEISRTARKQLRRAPRHVVAKLATWVDEVEDLGVEEVRRRPGYHDHPLKGRLAGKRAVSLSRKWRAVYEIRERENGMDVVEFLNVEEVHPHDY